MTSTSSPPPDTIFTDLGTFSKEKFQALVTLRHKALQAIRNTLIARGLTEVTTASLVNIAGSCENPHAAFTLPYYGRQAHLSQSAQLQLEALVLRLRKGFFTVNNSFREEHFDDPEAAGRRLSEFTLIEPEKPFLSDRGQDPLSPFTEYFNLFSQEPPLLRGGFGIGFERFIGFLIGSTDILETITHRMMKPE